VSIVGSGSRGTHVISQGATRRHPAYAHTQRPVIVRPPVVPVVVAVLPFAYTTEAQLPDGTALWQSGKFDHPDLIGSGTELLLLVVVVASVGWHMIRLVAVNANEQP
jgi:hypothetical protein